MRTHELARGDIQLYFLSITSFSSEQWERAFISKKHLYSDNASIKVPFISPPPEIPNFTRRSKELEKLQQLLLTPDGSHKVRIAGLVGTGGMGKSTLAGYFASEYQAYFPDGVISLRVGHKTTEALIEELCDLTVSLSSPVTHMLSINWL